MATSLKNLSDFSQTEVADAAAFRFGIVVAEWNAEITQALYDGAYEALIQHGAQEEHIKTIKVPGTYELIAGADMLLAFKNYNAIICLGCVIQGETRHFDFICAAAANGIAQVAIKYNKPVVFGVLTTDNLEQAKDRSGGKHGNKGVEAAITAIQMASLQHQLAI
jgi:6,7-dimethyl-8-ribityllumazine synthase